MLPPILIVDDNKSMLCFAEQVFKSKGYVIITMTDPLAALDYLKNNEVAVLITDNNMPGMSGLELIEKANRISSETIKIFMTAYADLSVALCAINQCQVFKFIPKPWKPKEMVDAVKDALRRYRTLQVMRRENDDILQSLAQTIELKDPRTKGHCDRVGRYAVQLAKALDLPPDMQREIKYGSWLHDCGKIGIPEKTLNARRSLTGEERELMRNHSAWGADVAAKANLSGVVVNIIKYHHEKFNGQGYPSGLAGEEIPIEARIVAIADVFDALSSDRPYRQHFEKDRTIEIIMEMKGQKLDPTLVDLFMEHCLTPDGNMKP